MPPSNKEEILIVHAKVGYALYRRAHDSEHITNISDRNLALCIKATTQMLADFSDLPAPPAPIPAPPIFAPGIVSFYDYALYSLDAAYRECYRLLEPSLQERDRLNPRPESAINEKYEAYAKLECFEGYLEVEHLEVERWGYPWGETPSAVEMKGRAWVCCDLVREYKLAREVLSREEVRDFFGVHRGVDVAGYYTEEEVRREEVESTTQLRTLQNEARTHDLRISSRRVEPNPSCFSYNPLMASNKAFERRYAQLALESSLETFRDEELYRVEELGGTLHIPGSNDSCFEEFFTTRSCSDEFEEFEDDFDDGVSIHSVEIDRSQPFSWVAAPSSCSSGGNSNSDIAPFNLSKYIAETGLPPYLTDAGMPYQSTQGPHSSQTLAQASGMEGAALPSLFGGMEGAGVRETSESVGEKFVEVEVKKANKAAHRERRRRKGLKRGIVHKQGGIMEEKSKNPFETISPLGPVSWE